MQNVDVYETDCVLLNFSYPKQLQIIKSTKIELCIRTPLSSSCESFVVIVKVRVLQKAVHLSPLVSLSLFVSAVS